MNINSNRLWSSLMDLAKIGATPKGGVRRLALTELDGQARDLFIRWCKEAGCTITIDGIGNIFARRARERRLRCRRSSPAATSTRSLQAASSTATTA